MNQHLTTPSRPPAAVSREIVSALMDSQLRADEVGRALSDIGSDPSVRAAWRDYHFIGEALRGGASAARPASDAFARGVMSKLAQDAVDAVADPVAIKSIATEAHSTWALSGFDSKTPSANDSSFRWKLVAGVASLAAVASIGWSLVSTAPSARPQLASTSPTPANASVVLTGTSQGVMIRDPRLDELLEAHRQMGSPSAMTMPAGAVRNASLQGSAR